MVDKKIKEQAEMSERRRQKINERILKTNEARSMLLQEMGEEENQKTFVGLDVTGEQPMIEISPRAVGGTQLE